MNIPHELKIKPSGSELDDVLLLVARTGIGNPPVSGGRGKTESIAMDKANEVMLQMAQKLAVIATATWKMQNRLIDAETDSPRETFEAADGRKLARDVQTLLTALSEMGITIRDRTGQSFDYGMPEKVVDAKPQPGITKERVVETLRPTITWATQAWKDTMIQKGEVIIQTPQE